MRRVVLVVAALCLFPTGRAAAQRGAGTPSAAEQLQGVQRHIDALRYAEAREAIGRWWSGPGDGAAGDLRARALFLRAVLADSAEAAERDLLRLAVEHPQAPEADRALFRLAQSRLAHGDTAAAHLFLERLVTDHPQSGERDRAVALLGRPQAPRQATPPSAPTRPAADPPPAPRAAAAPSQPVPSGPEFTVQVGAFPTVREAEALRDALRGGGFRAFIARVGHGGDTVVRVGSFRDRREAESLAVRIRAAGHAPRVVTVGGS